MASAAASSLLLAFLLTTIPSSSLGGPLHTEFLYPNFTASNLLYVDTSGVFLASPNSTFTASICNPGLQQSSFYLCVRHAPTAAIIWAANRSAPVSSSAFLTLSSSALSLSAAWSTPPLPRPISSLRLLDSGNLLLLDSSNATLWQTFDHPTDTLVSGQRLRQSLTSSSSDTDLSEGDYRMDVTATDAVLLWKGAQQYWSMSGDVRAFRNSDAAVSHMEMNVTGLFLLSAGGHALRLPLPAAGLHIARVDSGTGQLVISSYASASDAKATGTLYAPSGGCDLPFSCKALGLCTRGSGNVTCSCAEGFASSAGGGCLPSDGSALFSSCGTGNSSSSSAEPSYKQLPSGVGYFAAGFLTPTATGKNVSACRLLCSSDCECLAFYHSNASGACFLLKDQLGSLSSPSDDLEIDYYVKVLPASGSPVSSPRSSPALLRVLLPLLLSVALFLLLVLLLLIFCRKRARDSKICKPAAKTTKESGRGRPEEDSGEEGDEDDISIPGLPTRFTYEELEAATEGFAVQIGSGGFGVVYKGVLPDNSTVAVKKLAGVGVHGRKEFCTEIAVIGNIRHVNLVRLRGFCAQGSRRMLVYEYMDRGSLDRSLFAAHGRPVMEWQERVDVALGAARGLAYLHGGCEQKILHCDVKPENILLDGGRGAKISDFGLSKLLSPEQTSLVTTLRGTRGYLAPEWITNTPISDRTDVYSFGMVLLEIVHGRKNCSSTRATNRTSDPEGRMDTEDTISTTDGEESYYPLVALEKHQRRCYDELVDPRLAGRVTTSEVERMVKVALCCLHEEPARRPSMAMVAGMLDGTVPLWEPRVESLSFLRFYARGATEPSGNAGMGTIAANRGYFEILGNTTQVTTNRGSSDSSVGASDSFISSQQVSGPR